MKANRSLVVSAGLGFISGLFISPLLIRSEHTENFLKDDDDIELESGPEPLTESMLQYKEQETPLVAENVRVLCWIMTGPTTHQSKARHVKATWGPRCNKLLFMSSQADPDLPTVKLNVSEGRNNLWDKTKNAFQYVYNNHYEDYDWFVKADDDTYMVVENLRYFLKDFDTNKPIFFGRKLKLFGRKQVFFSGGAGYVLSKEALKRFVETGLKNPKLCRRDAGGAEDVEMGKCLEHLGVEAVDSRDPEGRKRFFPWVPSHHLIPGNVPKGLPKKYLGNWQFYPEKKGLACCSDYAISFHHVPATQMYVLEYLIYHLRPYGINLDHSPEDIKVLGKEDVI